MKKPVTKGKGKEPVVLSWPYKQYVMEGGAAKGGAAQEEIFWHEHLHKREIDALFSKKLFTRFRHYTIEGEKPVTEFSYKDNLVIKGNNLVALHSISELFAGRVKLIYIDPPYNTGNGRFNYHDTFSHSSWLTFMRNRLEIAEKLLAPDGTVWINIDDKESHYLKVLCDEIFGRENFVINFIWQKKYSPANDSRWFSDTHDHILVFAKNKALFKPNLLPRSEEMNSRYSNPDNDPRGPWKPGGFSVKSYTKEYDYGIETPSGKIVYPPKGSCWQTSKENYLKRLADNRIWFGVKGSGKPQIKQFLSEVQAGMVAKSIWTYDEVGHNQVSRREIVKLFGDLVFATPKPERLLKRIIELGTRKGDLVLDFFLGSGTTAAVAHKMNRRYIAIDQMDYIEKVAVARLQKVIAGEPGGVSGELAWEGGGSFKFMELMTLNDHFRNRWTTMMPESDIHKLFTDIMASSFIIDRLNGRMMELRERFEDLSNNDKHQFIRELLDTTDLFVNLDNNGHANEYVNAEDRVLNQQFYSLKE